DISAAIKLCVEYINAFGGHPGAAGLSLPVNNISIFRSALSRAVESIRDKSIVINTLPIDAEITLDRATIDLAQQLDRLAPFGEGNPAITLATRSVTLHHDRKFGRKNEHREVTVTDESGTLRSMIWWRGANADLPQSQFDVAYSIKPTDFRGEPNLSIEWIDFQVTQVPVIEVSAPKIEMEIIDWRSESNLAEVIFSKFADRLKPSHSLAIWSDGIHAAPLPIVRRYDLIEAEVLIIWSPPCGWRELSNAIEQVKPKRIYLGAVEASEDRLEPFLKRLAGLLKHDLTQRNGRVEVARLAAALGQRLATTRKGIEWLEDAGQIKVSDWGDSEIIISATGGDKSTEAAEVQSELKVLLAETAAWRAYYRRMDVAQIRALVR
ncbi:MAG TPA: hypothetical protein VFF70_05825, partial [Anaerolineae bacterium]|nr:hypothetical protein [Anaerolineae bacterium]